MLKDLLKEFLIQAKKSRIFGEHAKHIPGT